MDTNILSQEINTYNQNKENLLKDNSGKFVLIKGNKIIGIYDTQNDAIKIGIDKFGNTPFLVKKIEEVESVQNFTSNLILLEQCPL
ncbi:MAG: hypothetical protein OQK82_02230 [Candidatus Pacearchaeota archaeon]|nr:hypothetical protein [Candidatus Pacearchaeota archaeon]